MKGNGYDAWWTKALRWADQRRVDFHDAGWRNGRGGFPTKCRAKTKGRK